VYSKGGGNAVYLIDSRTGAMLRALPGLRTPVSVAVDPARSHIFVADTHRNAVLEYDSLSGALERAVPSCSGTEDLALSTATQHLFVRCTDGTILMQDLATGSIIAKLTSQATGSHNFATNNFGTDAQLALQEQTHRLVVADQATGSARLYDSATGRLITTLSTLAGGYVTDTGNNTVIANAYSPNACAQPAAGRFQVVDAKSGAVLATHSVPYKNVAVRLANPRTGHLLADITGRVDSGCHYLSQGSLAVLDARNAHVLRLLPAGYSPTAMLIDHQSGLLLQLSRGTGTKAGTIIVFDLAQL
jgi:DNA-binding beta-propeller fold protein YncE